MTAAIANPYRVAMDYDNLAVAARELFEENFHARDDEAVRLNAEQAANSGRALKSLPRRRTLTPGYYMRALYLVDLDQMLRAGLTMRPSEMDRDEYYGLMAVRAGKSEFDAAHPGCPYCGARNDRLAYNCRECGKEFKR